VLSLFGPPDRYLERVAPPGNSRIRPSAPDDRCSPLASTAVASSRCGRSGPADLGRHDPHQPSLIPTCVGDPVAGNEGAAPGADDVPTAESVSKPRELHRGSGAHVAHLGQKPGLPWEAVAQRRSVPAEVCSDQQGPRYAAERRGLERPPMVLESGAGPRSLSSWRRRLFRSGSVSRSAAAVRPSVSCWIRLSPRSQCWLCGLLPTATVRRGRRRQVSATRLQPAPRR
jgi:hypothetical protein